MRAAWLLVVCVVAAACGGPVTVYEATPVPSPSPSPQPRAAAPPLGAQATPDPAGACVGCWPFTGLPTKPDAPVFRRPLLVKIDNAPAGRPHYGITQADAVFEILVEGLVTRLAVVFHSQDPASIGNVRSARLADRSLTPMVRGALVYSGTSAYELPLIRGDAAQGRYVDLSADYTGGYYRVAFRGGPYDMFTSAVAMRQNLAALGATTVTDIPKWGFLADPDHPPQIAGMAGAAAATEITVPYRPDSSLVTYRYDASARSYARFQNAASRPVREVDGANNAPVAAANVVVIQTEIWEVPEIVDAAGAHAHDMRLVGTGVATVFRDGLRQDGTWSRKDDRAPFVFTNAPGEQILLTPGQTWFHIIPNDWRVISR